MKLVPIYLHGEHSREAQLVEVDENASVQDIINLYHKLFPGTGNIEDIQLFVQDEHHHRHKHHSGEEAGVGKKHHLHCHRCTSVATSISYNGVVKPFKFPPAATGKEVMKQACISFGINEADAKNYLLKLGDATIIQATDHIGSFTTFPKCALELFITPTKPVNG